MKWSVKACYSCKYFKQGEGSCFCSHPNVLKQEYSEYRYIFDYCKNWKQLESDFYKDVVFLNEKDRV